MDIVKFVKKGNNNYQIVFDNGKSVNVSEDIIIKYNLLYKKQIDSDLLDKLILENEKYDIYNKCVKYIGVRLRSINEMKEYMNRKNIDQETIDNVISRLINNKLLNDEVFAKAFINDKLNFTTMGPYRIEQELKKHKIDSNIIKKYIMNIDMDTVSMKINKQINKIIKSTKNKNNLKNKIYSKLISLGYPGDLILDNLNKFDF